MVKSLCPTCVLISDEYTKVIDISWDGWLCVYTVGDRTSCGLGVGGGGHLLTEIGIIQTLAVRKCVTE